MILSLDYFHDALVDFGFIFIAKNNTNQKIIDQF